MRIEGNIIANIDNIQAECIVCSPDEHMQAKLYDVPDNVILDDSSNDEYIDEHDIRVINLEDKLSDITRKFDTMLNLMQSNNSNNDWHKDASRRIEESWGKYVSSPISSSTSTIHDNDIVKEIMKIIPRYDRSGDNPEASRIYV